MTSTTLSDGTIKHVISGWIGYQKPNQLISKTNDILIYDDYAHHPSEIKTTLNGLKRAYNFASQHRAIGLGVLGYHSLFQSKLIEFESLAAKQLNNHIFKHLKVFSIFLYFADNIPNSYFTPIDPPLDSNK